MLNNLPSSVNKIYVNTGNILSLNEIKKLAGHNQTDEFLESLKITLSSWQNENSEEWIVQSDAIQISRLQEKSSPNLGEENERDSLKVGIKVFVSSAKKEVLRESLANVFTSLNVTRLDSLVVACKLEPSAVLVGLQDMWSVIEELAADNRLGDIGVSDIDTDVFIALYNWAKIKPSIIQINLAVCCVVPPLLQEFCKSNSVQLLTHSDPLDILPRAALYQVFRAKESDQLSLIWAVRFLVHVKCRGVLSNKGYIACVGLQRPNGALSQT